MSATPGFRLVARKGLPRANPGLIVDESSGFANEHPYVWFVHESVGFANGFKADSDKYATADELSGEAGCYI